MYCDTKTPFQVFINIVVLSKTFHIWAGRRWEAGHVDPKRSTGGSL